MPKNNNERSFSGLHRSAMPPALPVGQGRWLNPDGSVPPRGVPPQAMFGAGSNADPAKTGFKGSDLGIPIILDGAIYLLGGDSFSGNGLTGTWYQAANTISRLNPDGSIDNTFHTPTNLPTVINNQLNPALLGKTPQGQRPNHFLPGGVIDTGYAQYAMLVPTYMQEPTAPGLIYRVDSPSSWVFIGQAPPAPNLRNTEMAGYTDSRGITHIVMSNVDRRYPPVVTSVLANRFAQISAWQPVKDLAGGFGATITPRTHVGELDMKELDGKTVLTYANGNTITALVAANPESLTRAKSTVFTMPNYPPPNTKTNLYAPYILPGSTLHNIQVEVSDWPANSGGGAIQRYPYGTYRAQLNPYV